MAGNELASLVVEWKAAREAFMLAPEYPHGDAAKRLDAAVTALLAWTPAPGEAERAEPQEGK